MSNINFDRRQDFKVTCGDMDGKTDPAEHLAGLIYLDVQIGDDCISGWVRPEVAATIKAAFGKPVLGVPTANESRAIFAAMAMQGICSAGETWPRANDGSHIAETAVQIADALIARLS